MAHHKRKKSKVLSVDLSVDTFPVPTDGVWPINERDGDTWTQIPVVFGPRRYIILRPDGSRFDEDEPPPHLHDDTIATLLDYARAGNEADFRWLAAACGVRPERIEALWAGTRVRVGL